MNKDLEMKLVRSLVWIVLNYGVECWTLTKADENDRISRTVDLTRICYESVGLNIEHTKVSLQSLTVNTTRRLQAIDMRRKLPFFGHAIRDGGCEMVKCAIEGWLKAWNKSRGIALDGEDLCHVRHGRLIITPDEIGKKKNILFDFLSSLIRLIRHAINYHSNAFASSAKSWITSSKFSFAIVH